MKNWKLILRDIITGSMRYQLLCWCGIVVIVVVVICGGVALVDHTDLGSYVLAFFAPDFAREPITWFHPVVSIFGTIIFSGVLISVITNVIFDYRDRYLSGQIEYAFKNHIVIIGFDEIVPGLVRQLVRSPQYQDAIILIHSSNPLEDVKNKIHVKLHKNEEKRIAYVHSMHPSKEELLSLHTTDAQEIFIVGDRTQNDHDSENMHIMRMLSEIHTDANAPQIPITIWFEQETSYAALQLNDIKKAWSNHFKVSTYNFYKDWANRLFAASHYHRGKDRIIYPEVDHKGIYADSKKHVHLVVVGMNRMGIAVGKEAAHLLHFPNFNEKTLENQTVITFIDDQADKELRFLQGRLPGYFEIAPTYYADAMADENKPIVFDKQDESHNFLDVRFEFIKGRMEALNMRAWLIEQAKDENQYLTVIVCLHNPSKSLGSGLYLPEELYKEYGDDHYTNIFIRQETSSSMVENLRLAAREGEGQNKRYAHIYPFGMVNNSIDIECQDTTMAKAFNYIYDYYFNNKHMPESLPDRIQLEEIWDKLSISNQWSNIYLSDSVEFKLRAIGYDLNSGAPLTISNKDLLDLSRAEHNRWNMEKLLIGYRALHEDEWQKADAMDTKARSEYFKTLKKNFFIHHCIVPNDPIAIGGRCLDESTKALDQNIISTLPMVMRYALNK